MARSKVGADILPLSGISAKDRPAAIDQLQPGDLVFFKLDTRTGQRLDHVGMVLGHDTEGHLIFVSSREEVNGPTIGDVGGVSRLDGNGYYAKTLRSATRLGPGRDPRPGEALRAAGHSPAAADACASPRRRI